MADSSDGYRTVILKGGAYEKVLKHLKESLANIRCQPVVDDLQPAIQELESAIDTLERAD